MFEFINRVAGVKTAPFFLIDVLVISGLIDFIVSYTDAESGEVLHRSMYTLHCFHHHRFVYVRCNIVKNFTVFTTLDFPDPKQGFPIRFFLLIEDWFGNDVSQASYCLEFTGRLDG